MLEEALRLVSPSDEKQQVHLHSRLALALYWSSDTQRCLAAADSAVAAARKLKAPATLAHGRGDRRQALVLGQEAHSQAEKFQIPLLVADAMMLNSVMT